MRRTTPDADPLIELRIMRERYRSARVGMSDGEMMEVEDEDIFCGR